MRAFRAVGGRYVAGVGPTEREVFATVVADVAQLLGAERFDAPGEGRPDRPVGSGPLAGLRMSAGALDAPQDPAVRRLLPDASRDDDAVSAEFRRLTEADLRASKIERLRAVWRALVAADPDDADASDLAPDGPTGRAGGHRAAADDDDDLAVAPADAAGFAAALTDVRLVLAERLGLETEDDADRLYAALEAQAAAEEDAVGLGAVVDDDRPAREILAQEARAYLGAVYAALSWLQETLMTVLLDELDRSAD